MKHLISLVTAIKNL